jgi:RimJ/RimL family protein N-acetyltransferase
MSELRPARVMKTARLELEPIRAKHAMEAWPHLDDARMWTFFPKLRPQSLEGLRLTYARWENPYHAKSELRENWACRDRRTGQLVGTMQATTFPARAVSYIAYGIFIAYQRQGYAREAVEAILDHLREELHSRRIFAEMDVENNASFRLVESLGFKRVKKRHTVDSKLGVDGDSYLYELVM